MATRMPLVGALAVLAALVEPLHVGGATAAPSSPGVSSVCVDPACPQPASVVVGSGPLMLRLRFVNAKPRDFGGVEWTVPPSGLAAPQEGQSLQPGFVTIDRASQCNPSNLTVTGRAISIDFGACNAQEWVQVLYENVVVPTQSTTATFPTRSSATPWSWYQSVQNRSYASPPIEINPATLIIRPAAPDHLAFTQQPSTAMAGQVISPPVLVQTQDKYGNATPDVRAALDIGLQNSTGAVLHGTLREPTVKGIATFRDLMTTTAGHGYRLISSAGGLTPATSAPFDILPAAPDHLAFTRQPRSTPVGQIITPAVGVGVLDRFGNVAMAATATVELSLQHSPPVAGLRGTSDGPVVKGAAMFADLSVGVDGQGYRLVATSTGLRGATSDAFDIRSGPPPPPDAPDHLAFVQQPRSTVAGGVISPAVVVQVQDRLGNVARTAGATVDLTMMSPAGDPPLRGTTSLPSRSGLASFADLAVTAAGRGYRLHATSGTLGGATSDPFDITAGAPARLVFISEPGGHVTLGNPFRDQPRVALEDAYGNSVGIDPTVALEIAGGSGVPGARLMCDGGDLAPTVQGVASFTGCAIDRAGGRYRLAATSERVDQALSDPFDVVVVVPSPSKGSGAWIWVLVGSGLGIGALLIILGLLEVRHRIDSRRARRAAATVRVVPRDGSWELGVIVRASADGVHSVRVSIHRRPTMVNVQEVAG